jgi:ABC-type transporter Mla subunit MlaD
MAARSTSKRKDAAPPAGGEHGPAKSSSKPRTGAAKRSAPSVAEPSPELQAAVEALREVAARLGGHCDNLSRALAEIPRADDFQPLADHLYDFARTAPHLVERFEELPRAAAPLVESVGALRELTDTLGAFQQSLQESLFLLPRASDYEPLAEPLRRFAQTSPALVEALTDVQRAVGPLTNSARAIEAAAQALSVRPEVATPGGEMASGGTREAAAALSEFARVSPALIESLGALARLARPLSGSVDELGKTAERIEATWPGLAVAADGIALAANQGLKLVQELAAELRPATRPATAGLREAGGEVEAARSAIVRALESLPRASDYAPLASQLRELATVSPSLMSWLQELPAVTVPLGQSVESLWDAVCRLKAAGAALQQAADAAAERAPGALAEEALGRLVALRQQLAESRPEDDRLREILREIGRESARLRRHSGRPPSRA